MVDMSDSEGSSTTDFLVVDPRLEHLDEDDDLLPPPPNNALIEDLYEGPKVCACCVNWIDDFPEEIRDQDPTRKKKGKQKKRAEDEEGRPLVVRRWARWSASGSHLAIDTIEVRHAATRAVLHSVFDGFENIHPNVRILIFRAPFKPFFWRWKEFKAAIAAEKNAEVLEILTTLHDLVKTDLADVFSVYRELVPHGVITYPYLWTLFSPGDLLYQPLGDNHGAGRLFGLRSVAPVPLNGDMILRMDYVDWDGSSFGLVTTTMCIPSWIGTRPIRSLPLYPIRYARNSSAVLQRLLERGHKFAELTKKRYMAYRSSRRPGFREMGSKTRNIDERIVLDTNGHPRRVFVGALRPTPFTTHLILQHPVRSITEGFHTPLPDPRNPAASKGNHFQNGVRVERSHAPVPPQRYEEWDEFDDREQRDAFPPPGRSRVPPPPRRFRGSDSDDNSDDSSVAWRRPQHLTNVQLQLCHWNLLGFNLKSRRWEEFDITDIHEIEFDPKPFDNLVLPDGYKDLILAFVESQVNERDSFGDLINGKGGGLTILLSGAPGVGKTLTAESVAEKIKAPLYKLELGEGRTHKSSSRNRSRSPSPSSDVEADDFTTAFQLCSRWNAVLLLDECDLYLEKRSEVSSSRNSIVTRFLRELEYYPSLLFLTTNRERSLDPAVYSRVHLTINYPQLDRSSRLQIWKTFLAHMDTKSDMTEAEVEALAAIDVDGRCVRNVVKTARILARRKQRPICFEDVKNVMRITESLTVEKPGQRLDVEEPGEQRM